MRPWALALVPVLALLPPGSRTAVSPCCESGDLDAFNGTHWQCLGPDNATGPVRIDCRPEDVQVVLMAMDLFEITPEGHLDMYSDNLYINRIEMSEYCRGNVSEGLVASGYGNSTHREAAAVCETGDPARKLVSEEYIGYCMILSAVFFAITGVVYIAVPDLRDLQGKSIINLCLCLTVGLSVLAAMKIMESYDNMDLCAARGMFVYFFIIAGFFWMNSIAVQFLMSIRWSSRARGGGWRPFVWFALYSWGGAAALASLVALVNFNAGRHPKPGIGLNHCWFISSKQQWIYMYSVMTVLMLLNLAIFVYASVLLWRHSFRSTHLSELKYKFTMTSRLYVLLGLPWIFEMIVSSAPKYYLLEVLDLFTALQGVLVFVVLVVSRRRARAGLRALLPALCSACCAPPDGAERQPDRLDAPDQTALFLSMTNYKNDCAGDGDGDEDARARN